MGALVLAVTSPELRLLRSLSEAKEARPTVQFGLAVTNFGPNTVELKKLEFCAWQNEQLVAVTNTDYFDDGDNILSPDNLYSHSVYFHGLSDLLDKISVQLTVEIGKGSAPTA